MIQIKDEPTTAEEMASKEFWVCHGFTEYAIPEYVIRAMKDYARLKCKEQRSLCGQHLDKAPNGYSGVSYGFITQAPEPNFD